jgi:hypothetical protein
MDAFGLPAKQILSHILQVDIGYTPLMDGHGHLITIGVGHRSTTVVGPMIRFMDGCGFQVTNGDQHGYHGEQVVAIMAGVLLAPEWASE